MTFQVEHSSGIEQWSDLKGNLEALRAVLQRHGVQRPAITDRHFAHFCALEESKRDRILAASIRELQVYASAEEENIDFNDNLDLLKHALKYLNMNVDPEFFKLIKSTDVVELYNLDHIQLFRSFNFFSLCNYNLDDIMVFEWFNLYDRAKTVTDSLIQEMRNHLSGDERISVFKTSSHLMKENFSEPKGLFRITLQYITSTFAGPDHRSGYVVTQTCNPLNVLSS